MNLTAEQKYEAAIKTLRRVSGHAPKKSDCVVCYAIDLLAEAFEELHAQREPHPGAKFSCT